MLRCCPWLTLFGQRRPLTYQASFHLQEASRIFQWDYARNYISDYKSSPFTESGFFPQNG
jgi:hypothetical protein